MRNRVHVKIISQGLPLELKCITNEKTLDQKLTLCEPVIPLEILKQIVNKKNFAYKITPDSSRDVYHLKPKDRYSQQPRPRNCYQTDPVNEESSLFIQFCICCR